MTIRNNAAEYEHPDADQLAAFAERALRGAEHQQMTAHLAGCSRCREIVFLAQEAELETRASAPAIAVGRPAWWSGRAAWAAGAACVLVVAIAATVVVVRQDRVKPVELASVRRVPAPAAALDAGHVAPAPAPAAQKDGVTMAPARKAAAPRARTTGAAAGAALPGKAGTAEASGALLAAPQEFAAATPPAASSGPELSLHSYAMRRAPMRAVDRRQGAGTGVIESPSEAAQIAGVAAGSLQARKETGAAAPLIPARVGPAAKAENSPETASVTVLPENAALDAFQTQQAGLALRRSVALPVSYAVRDGAIERRVEGRRMVLTLPGRARAAAVASLPTALLALDASGSVFLSRDRGHQWSTVAKQWAGKAVTISVQGVTEPPERTVFPAANVAAARVMNGAHADPESRVSAAPAVRSGPLSGGEARGFFQLMNDQGKSWVSLDSGKTWLPR
jgi:hypothetical protein